MDSATVGATGVTSEAASSPQKGLPQANSPNTPSVQKELGAAVCFFIFFISAVHTIAFRFDAESPTNYDDHPKEIYSPKLFIGGIQRDVPRDTIVDAFSKFGPLVVDWPITSDNGGDLKGKRQSGYLLIVYEQERSVQMLLRNCYQRNGKTYFGVSSPPVEVRPVEVRPWRLSDISFMPQKDVLIDHRRTVFVGGVPKSTTAGELARLMNVMYGPVCYAGIHVDPELRYPKGAARVTFATERGFIKALNARFMFLHRDGIWKRVEVKAYVMKNSMCDECGGVQNCNNSAVRFCPDLSCVQYFCEHCWRQYHSPDVRVMSYHPSMRSGKGTWFPGPQLKV